MPGPRHSKRSSQEPVLDGDGGGDLPDRERWSPVVIGEPVLEFEPKPPHLRSYRPDTICDGWSTEHFTVRLASVRGYSHRYSGTPRQDDAEVAIHTRSGAVIFAVADGVSSARNSHIGATTACRAAIYAIGKQLTEEPSRVNWNEVFAEAARSLFDRTAVLLRTDRPDRAAVLDQLATTLVTGYVIPTPGGSAASLARAGDSTAWVLRPDGYRPVFAGKHDPRAEVISSAVTSLPLLPDRVVPADLALPADAVLLIGTDGFADPLGDGDGPLGRLFANLLRTPAPPREYAHVLDFSRETFDDDRTLVSIWPRPPLREEAS